MHQKAAALINSLPLFGKIFFSSLSGLIILALLIFSLWQQFFADTFRAWVPAETVFYAHLSLPRYNSNDSYDQLARAALAAASLGSTTDNLINRELAFAVKPADGDYQLLTFLRADSPSRLEKMLTEKQLPFRRLDRQRFVVGKPEIINSLQKNQPTALIEKLGKHYSPWSSAFVYGQKQFLAAWLQRNGADYWQFALLSLNRDEEIYLNLFSNQEKNWGWLGESRGRKKIKATLPAEPDLLFNLSNAKELLPLLSGINWPPEIQQDLSEARYSYGLDPADPLLQSLAGNKVSGRVTARAATTTGWFWADNEILVTLTDQLSPDQVQTLENTFQHILARQRPQDRKIPLHDGSFITERILKPELIEFSPADGWLASNSELPVRIFYQTSTAGLTFTNNQALLADTSTASFGFDFISLKTKLLNSQGLWNFLKYFQTLEIYNNGQIIIK